MSSKPHMCIINFQLRSCEKTDIVIEPVEDAIREQHGNVLWTLFPGSQYMLVLHVL